ncbi:DUF2490 domain-containing protein [Draconibacterium sp. IB214405]|uniref:DUF2490 domain-containing protein n=1 Tax=Draconibacterium sp. IB214405 TaxID=3097352 RepID=UPI002A0B093B|nr:DUF2490 domain-containing protein [Draconibacterium sp. IB214405]MDX8339581.1 DUF2490 domain-containing protein [Draconibacterium sp. IB214405]
MQKLYVLLFILLSLNSFAQERQFELWNKNQLSATPWKNISIDVAEKMHYSPKRSILDLKYGEIYIGHQVLNWLEYGAGFRVSSTNLQIGEWLQENRPMAFVNFGKDVGKIEFDFYNRFEYRTYKTLKNYFRYRQSLRMKFPAITDWGMQFYLQEESFLKLNGAGTHLARLYSGLTAFEKEHVEIKIYYALQKQEILSHWLTSDILGLNLTFEI